MRLLIITQKVDLDDPVLGFFHNWIARLAPHFEKVVVIALGVGRHDLPENVKVFSLGKKLEASSQKLVARIKYALNFYRFIFGLEYDSVFVHMNQEYILLGGWFWKLLGKKIFFWRNHPKGNFWTRIAIWLSNKVFYTSLSSFTAKFKKSVIMPVGINTNLFKPHNLNPIIHNSILCLGRISPIKNVHLMLETARILREKGIAFTFDIVGDPVNPEDSEYKKKLVNENKDLIGSGHVNFTMGAPNHKTPEIYSSHEIFINLTPSGSMDKTILEAAACGCIPISVNPVLEGIDKNLITSTDPVDIAVKIEIWLKKNESEKANLRTKLSQFVIANHSLDSLVSKLVSEIKNASK